MVVEDIGDKLIRLIREKALLNRFWNFCVKRKMNAFEIFGSEDWENIA